MEDRHALSFYTMALEKFNLEGKTALITGASGLLGQEHSAALLESGAKVILTDINQKGLEEAKNNLLQEYGHRSILIKRMNVTKIEEVRTVQQEILDEGNRVDILINNAAIDPKVTNESGIGNSSRLENFNLNEWNLQLEVGLSGAFICCQVFGSNMAFDNKGGVILNISSDLSVISPDQRLYEIEGTAQEMQPVKPVTYSVIKTGLVGLTRYVATYWSEKGVRCNALSPGGVYNQQNDDFVMKLKDLIPLKRMADHDEYRSAVQFLCSDASSYMNGQNIVIDGGRSVW